MLGRKERVFETHKALCLDDLVPSDHFYRQLEAKLDLSFVRQLVQDGYAQRKGRPSIDPIVYFKLQLIMFFEAIRSERQLMEQVKVNLAQRWYLGYDLGEVVPHHSSLSRIRDRYGLDTFQRFFEEVVERCCRAGLVRGHELYFDGTRVRANASRNKEVPRLQWEAHLHMQALFGLKPSNSTLDEHARGLVAHYSGQRRVGHRTHTSQPRQADTSVCVTDPDATPMYSQPGHSRLGY